MPAQTRVQPHGSNANAGVACQLLCGFVMEYDDLRCALFFFEAKAPARRVLGRIIFNSFYPTKAKNKKWKIEKHRPEINKDRQQLL